MDKQTTYLSKLGQVCHSDEIALIKAQKNYGESWKKRGGTGAFMMLARKWDRLENFLSDKNYDIFSEIEKDKRPEGIIDDIRDLRRYLLLVEAEMLARGILHSETEKDIIAQNKIAAASGPEYFTHGYTPREEI